MGLSTNGQHLQLRITTRVNTLFLHHLIETGDIGGNGMDGGSAKILDELNLSQRVTSCGRNGEHTQFLGTILEAETTSEHTITTGVLENIIRTQTYHPQVTCHLICPFVKVFLRVKNYGGVTRRTARRM